MKRSQSGDSLDTRTAQFASAIRYLQERILIFILAVAIVATGVSFWSLGRMTSSMEHSQFVITDLNEDVATLQLTVFQLQAGECPAPQGETDE